MLTIAYDPLLLKTTRKDVEEVCFVSTIRLHVRLERQILCYVAGGLSWIRRFLCMVWKGALVVVR